MTNTLDKIIRSLQTKLEEYREGNTTLPTYAENVELLANLQEIISKQSKDMLELPDGYLFKKQAI